MAFSGKLFSSIWDRTPRKPRVTTDTTFRLPRREYESFPGVPAPQRPKKKSPRFSEGILASLLRGESGMAQPPEYGVREQLDVERTVPIDTTWSDTFDYFNYSDDERSRAVESLQNASQAREERSNRLSSGAFPSWLDERVDTEVSKRIKSAKDPSVLASDPSMPQMASDILRGITPDQQRDRITSNVRANIRSWLDPASLTTSQLEEVLEWKESPSGALQLGFTPRSPQINQLDEQQLRYEGDPFFREYINRTGGYEQGFQRSPIATREEEIAEPHFKALQQRRSKEHAERYQGPAPPADLAIRQRRGVSAGATKDINDLLDHARGELQNEKPIDALQTLKGVFAQAPEQPEAKALEQHALRMRENQRTHGEIDAGYIRPDRLGAPPKPLTTDEMLALPLGDPRRMRPADQSMIASFASVPSDAALKFLGGTWGTFSDVAGLADFVGIESDLIKDFRDYADYRSSRLYEGLSSEQKEADWAVQSADTLGEAIGATGWRSAIGMAIESLPFMLVGGAITQGTRAGLTALGSALARGAVKKNIAIRIPETVKKLGAWADDWLMRGFGEGAISTGAALSDMRDANGGKVTNRERAWAAASGLGVMALGGVSNRLSRKWKIDDWESWDTIMAKEVSVGEVLEDLARAGSKNIISPTAMQRAGRVVERVSASSMMEGVEELGQSMWEQIAANIEGNRDALDGVSKSGFLGMVSGALASGGRTFGRATLNETKDAFLRDGEKFVQDEFEEERAKYLRDLKKAKETLENEGKERVISTAALETNAASRASAALEETEDNYDVARNFLGRQITSLRDAREEAVANMSTEQIQASQVEHDNEIAELERAQALVGRAKIRAETSVDVDPVATDRVRYEEVTSDEQADQAWNAVHPDRPRPQSNRTRAFSYMDDRGVVSVIPSREYFEQLKESDPGIKASYEDVLAHESGFAVAEAVLGTNPALATKIVEAASTGNTDVVDGNTVEYYQQLQESMGRDLTEREFAREIVAHEIGRQALNHARAQVDETTEEIVEGTQVQDDEEQTVSGAVADVGNLLAGAIERRPLVQLVEKVAADLSDKLGMPQSRRMSRTERQARLEGTTKDQQAKQQEGTQRQALAAQAKVEEEGKEDKKWKDREGEEHSRSGFPFRDHTGDEKTRLPEAFVRRLNGQPVSNLDELEEGEEVVIGGRKATIVKREVQSFTVGHIQRKVPPREVAPAGRNVPISEGDERLPKEYATAKSRDERLPHRYLSSTDPIVNTDVITEFEFADGSGEVVVLSWDPSLLQLNRSDVGETIRLRTEKGKKGETLLEGRVENKRLDYDRDGFKTLTLTIRRPNGALHTIVAKDYASKPTEGEQKAIHRRQGVVSNVMSAVYGTEIAELAKDLLTRLHPDDTLAMYIRVAGVLTRLHR